MTDSNQLLQTRVERSKEAWRRFGRQILTITPSQLARMLMAFAAVGAVVWVVRESWPALAPFLIGGVIAYTVLPFVNFLDRFMPRFLAASIGVLTAVGVVVGLAAIILPPLLQQFLRLMRDLPDATEVGVIVANLSAQPSLERLPETVRGQLVGQIGGALLRWRAMADGIVPSMLGQTPLLNIANTFASVLGLLVLPTWALVLLKDQPRVWPSASKALPSAIRADTRAIIRIIDGAFGTFLRSQVLLGIAVGLSTYAGLAVLERYAGLSVGSYKLLLAILSGVLQLIPGVGPAVNVVGTVALTYATRSLSAALQVLILYLLIQLVVGRFVSGRAESKLLDVHPAILILVIVALSQLGPLWFFLAAPIASVSRDLWRYLYGRANEPPLPAGLLPSERERYAQQVAAQRQAAGPYPLPAVYRRR